MGSNPQFNQNINNDALVAPFKSTFEFLDDFLVDQYKDNSLKTNEANINFMAKQSNDVAHDFIPNLNSKYLKLAILLLTAFVIYGKKFIVIKNKEEKKKEEEKKKQKDNAIDVTPVKQNDFFRNNV